MRLLAQLTIKTYKASTPSFLPSDLLAILFLSRIGPTEVSAKGGGAHAGTDGKSGSSSSGSSSSGSNTLGSSSHPSIVHTSNNQCIVQNTGLIVTCPLANAAIAGIIVGSVIASLLLAFLLWWAFTNYSDRRQRRRSTRQAQPTITQSGFQLLEGHVYPESAQDSEKITCAHSLLDSGTAKHNVKLSMPEPVQRPI
ncbi:hypothetical protein DFJ43DRAFT_1066744 [Lentinula guzmanii]|uniref:Uncharacterized protein n=1 Tax=Lentinula guzmanii TaxID=2804957 RepID=A0AA38JJ77_9AGAR|nr:hypothetical protein DFJ43DRAFT_1066744 [Lentinula guzmanii]